MERCWWWSWSEALVPVIGGRPMMGCTYVMPSLATYTTYSKTQHPMVPEPSWRLLLQTTAASCTRPSALSSLLAGVLQPAGSTAPLAPMPLCRGKGPSCVSNEIDVGILPVAAAAAAQLGHVCPHQLTQQHPDGLSPVQQCWASSFCTGRKEQNRAGFVGPPQSVNLIHEWCKAKLQGVYSPVFPLLSEQQGSPACSHVQAACCPAA